MVKDITQSHFWILLRMGYDVQRIYDANYSQDGDFLYLDYKEYVPYSKKREGRKLYDYIRYKICIPTRKQVKNMFVRREDGFDYMNYFKNNNYDIE